LQFYVFNGQHGASTLVNTMESLAMQLFENNDVINSQQAVWRNRCFWLDAMQCDYLNSWFYGWTLRNSCWWSSFEAGRRNYSRLNLS